MVPGVQLVTSKHNGLYHVAALRHLASQTELLLHNQDRKGQEDTVQRGQEDRAGVQRKRGKQISIICRRGSGESKVTLREISVEEKQKKTMQEENFKGRTKKKKNSNKKRYEANFFRKYFSVNVVHEEVNQQTSYC